MPLDAPFATAVEPARDGAARVHVTGELDLLTGPRIEACVAEALAAGHDVDLHLEALSFVDASGLHALLRARETARRRGHVVRLIGAGPDVRRTMRLVDLEGILDDPGEPLL